MTAFKYLADMRWLAAKDHTKMDLISGIMLRGVLILRVTLFSVDASEAGEGNLEISISAAGRNIPTQVHPQGSARSVPRVSFYSLDQI